MTPWLHNSNFKCEQCEFQLPCVLIYETGKISWIRFWLTKPKHAFLTAGCNLISTISSLLIKFSHHIKLMCGSLNFFQSWMLSVLWQLSIHFAVMCVSLFSSVHGNLFCFGNVITIVDLNDLTTNFYLLELSPFTNYSFVADLVVYFWISSTNMSQVTIAISLYLQLTYEKA